MSRFVCTNIKELQAKGLTPLDNSLLQDLLDSPLPEVGTVIIYDITANTMATVKPKVATDDTLWIITEDSFTDNFDDDTFTFFKYRVCRDKNDI